MTGHQTPSVVVPHVPWLDGLRGGAALWVVVSHISILTGLPAIAVLSWGGLAVDLFMMLSGFLMVHHYILRQHTAPWHRAQTATDFWQRRFFRIAPLYYVLLIVALLLGPHLGAYRDMIAAVWPKTATSPARYLDQSLINAVAHVSFGFGLLPDYAFRTALPDWSIGLEMQFYLVFPLLMITLARLGVWRAALGIAALCFTALWLWPGFFARFEMPAFLPLRLHVFFIGMLIAFGRAQGRLTQALAVALLILATSAVVHGLKLPLAQTGVALGLFYIMDDGHLPFSRPLTPALGWLRRALSGKISAFLGDTSYATYLLHLLILLPVAGMLAASANYVAYPAAMRFALVTVLVVPPTYLLGWLLHHTIEKPGIKLGRRLARRQT